MTMTPRSWPKSAFIFGGVALWAVLLISCTMVDRTVVAPPQVAGATFVGSKECAQCHEETVKDFDTATHAKLIVQGENAKGLGCESCHGPGSKHVQAGGGKGTIVNPGKSPETCFQCHLDKRGEFSLPHSHPVMSGKMSCTECHDPHKGNAIKGAGASTLAKESETCTECHTAQKGPFVFEHNAMREGCTACHNPHGSVSQKMLIQRDANLCLKCHLEHPATIGDGTIVVGENHANFATGTANTSRLNRGTCWSSGCHEGVHGSNINSHLRP
jgi:predicted CXXCH cytochrome family protein